jgi:glycosyltransferase involved in cell wall biosynthesis
MKIAILMCSYNGEDYIEEQLLSIFNQTNKKWKLYISDDGSKDHTLQILEKYQKALGKNKIKILFGPQHNFQENFLSLICNQKIKADLFFLCDQDDIWMPGRINYILRKIKNFDGKNPFLYCGRSTYINKNNSRVIGKSDLFKKKPSIENAIVQSIAGGNTMLFNEPLRQAVINNRPAKIVSHDWWLYILNELFDGKTYYDTRSTILYRQHSQSLIGGNVGIIAKIKRLRFLLEGKFKFYNDINHAALKKIMPKIRRDKRKVLLDFYSMREGSLVTRFRMINHIGLYRQTVDGNIALYLASLLKKI